MLDKLVLAQDMAAFARQYDVGVVKKAIDVRMNRKRTFLLC